MAGYASDLSYIHDAGFHDYAVSAAPGLLRLLRQNGVSNELVIDLGCGSGRFARELTRAGYRVFGIDQSPAMIKLARSNAPDAQFRIESLFTAELPVCDAVTSMGECMNYCFDQKRGPLSRLFAHIFGALRPGGVFICDFATPDRLPKSGMRKTWSCGDDWAVMSVSTIYRQRTLRRDITSFRKRGASYRRSNETHYLRLYDPADVIANLIQCGFSVRTLTGYGKFKFPEGIAGVVAKKLKADR